MSAPSPLVPRGAPIAVVAPCGICDPDRLEAGLQILRDAGHDPRPYPGMQRPWRYLAGEDDHRAAQLVDALTSPDWAAVWIARGGYGLTRILERVPFADLPRRPVLGFSDVTALLGPLHAAGAGPALHAPVVHSLPITDEASRAHLFDLLDGRPTPALDGATWVQGEARGWLCGGNLCLLAATCGTRWQLDARGAILVLEEIGEAPYRVDRMLRQLVEAGVFQGVVGVAVGELVGCRPPEGADWTLADVVLDHLRPLGVPVVGDLPIGHGARNRAFPWGARATLSRGRLSWSPLLS